jgi:hypothetical protein
MAETLPIEIASIAAAASKLSVTFFIVKSPVFCRNPITGIAQGFTSSSDREPSSLRCRTAAAGAR